MAKPQLKIQPDLVRLVGGHDARLLKIDVTGGPTSPCEAAEAVQGIAASLPGSTPVLLNGGAPVWLYGMLVHACHATPAVATYDPRLDGGSYVIVESHDPRWKAGDVVKVEKVEEVAPQA